MKKIQINQRRFKYGTLATLITIVFIAVIVLINIVASMLLERFPLKLDLTEDKIFSLSDETIDYLKALDKDIEITVLTEKSALETSGTSSKQVVEIINKYAQYTDKIKISYIDPDKNPEVMTKFNELYQGDVSSKFMVIQCGDRVKALASSDFVTYTSDDSSSYYSGSSSYTTSSTAEQSMTSAIMNVTDANPMKITVLTGESVYSDISELTSMLETNGYEIEDVDALTGTIDQESALVILNSPKNDLNQEQITKLDTYLSNDGKLGKNIMYIASYGQSSTPLLDEFLAEWGIEVGTGYVMESDSNNIAVIQNGVYGIRAYIGSNDYTEDVDNTSLPVLVYASRPINLLFDSKDTRSTVSLLSTANTACVIPDDVSEDTTIDDLPKAMQNVMAVGSKYVYDNDNNKSTSNIFTLGTGYLLESVFTQDSSYNNSDYVLSTINTLTGKSSGISIVSKDLTQDKLDMTQAQMLIVRNITLVGIPLIFVIIGIVVWARRRNR